MRLPMRVRKLIRPLIPDRVMARFRLHEHSRRSRVNVDVYVAGAGARRRWLSTTPDTYRVLDPERLDASSPYRRVTAAEMSAAPFLPDQPLVAGTADPEAVAPLVAALDTADLAVRAEVPPLRLAGRMRAEPQIAPVAMAFRPDTWEEIGGGLPGGHPLPALLDRARAAGHRIALFPGPPGDAPVHRNDPIAAPAVVVLAAVPLHDVGGGSRAAQIARLLLRRGYHVTFVNLFEADESVDLGLRYLHPRLEQVPFRAFDAGRLRRRLHGEPALALVELPARPLVGQVLRLRDCGFTVVYDLIDDWRDRSLGGEWYREDVERGIVAAADALVASAPDLAERLAAAGPVTLVPNGVDADLFGGEPGPAPGDLPGGDGPLFGYHGSLYGDWFDWAGLAAVADAQPGGRVVVIGDDKAPRPAMPPNVHFLGLKPQSELLAYVARFHVGLIPFSVSDTTHAVSPLKAYEYLAAGVPVAAPPLRSLAGIQGVHCAEDLRAAVQAALAAPRPDREGSLRTHSWDARVAVLFGAAGLDLAPRSDPGPRVVTRPVIHYGKQDRLG